MQAKLVLCTRKKRKREVKANALGGRFLLLFLEFADCYSVLWADFDTYAASPTEGVVCYYVPVVADLASKPLLGIGNEDRGGTFFQAFSAFKGTDTFCLIYLNGHCTLWNIKFS